MKIKTYYYCLTNGTNLVKCSVTIVNRQLMRNDNTGHPFSIRDKTDYKIKWLDKYDRGYHQDHDVDIIFDLDSKPFIMKLKLNWWQRIQMKIIWNDWIRNNENILWLIGIIITISIAIVGWKLACVIAQWTKRLK